jgi:hypothetical protein
VEGGRGRTEVVRQLVRVGAGDAGANQGFARADGPNRPDDRRAFGGNPGSLDPKIDDRFLGGTQQSVYGCEVQSLRVSGGGINDRNCSTSLPRNSPCRATAPLGVARNLFCLFLTRVLNENKTK